jgi:hypothetical protein
MIDLQSLVTANYQNFRTTIPRHTRVLPAGEGRGEGELRPRGRQSVLIKVGEHATRPSSRAASESFFVSLLQKSVSICVPRRSPTKEGVYPWLNSLALIPLLANPQRKSTAPHPKSTLDLGCEPLIRVEKGPANACLSSNACPFHPITTRTEKHAGQKQTDSNRKRNRSAD